VIVEREEAVFFGGSKCGDRRRERGSFGGKCGASHCNQWGFCGLVVLCREGWRRGSPIRYMYFGISCSFLFYLKVSTALNNFLELLDYCDSVVGEGSNR